MAKLAGPMWRGHHLCCGTEIDHPPAGNITLASPTGNVTVVLKAVATEPTPPNAKAKNFAASNKAAADAVYANVAIVSASSFIPGRTTVTTPPASKNRRAAVTKVDVFAPVQPPPRCLPLVSVNPIANVYHPALTGVKDANLRSGTSFPVPLGHGINCVNVNAPCTIAQTFTSTYTSSLSYSITTGTSSSVTKSLGTTLTEGRSTDIAQSISDTLEQSWSHTATTEEHKSVSDQLSDTLTKTSEVTLTNSHTSSDTHEQNGSETTNDETMTSYGGNMGSTATWGGSTSDGTTTSRSHMGGTNQDTTRSTTNSVSDNNGQDTQHCGTSSDSGTLTISSPQWFGGGVSGSYTHEQSNQDCSTGTHSHGTSQDTTGGDTRGSSTQDTNGRDNSHTTDSSWGGETSSQNNWDNSHTTSHGTSAGWSNGHTDSDETSKAQSDSISDAVTRSNTQESGWSTSAADTNGNSMSKTYGKTNTYSSSNTKADEVSKAMQQAKNIDQGTTKSVDVTQTMSQTMTFEIPLGACRIPVVSQQVLALAVPWACKDQYNETRIMATDIFPQNDAAQSQGLVSVIACHIKQFDFVVINDAYNSRRASGTPNTLATGQVLAAGARLTSDSGAWTLQMEMNGALTLRHYTDVKWSTNTGYLTGYNPRARILDSGRLVVEAMGFFNKVNYMTGNWTTMWATLPKNLNYQVGILGANGYSLVLQDDTSDVLTSPNGDPDLILYDSKGAPIWAALNPDYSNRLGFKHPLDYNMPTDVITGPNEPHQNDPHNAIAPEIKLLSGVNTLKSRADKCTNSLEQNTGLVSPNGRFKAVLDGTGNLLVKDGTRTMWSPDTARMWYATPPYKMQLSEDGELFIADAKGWQIFRTANMQQPPNAGPYSLQMLDVGRLAIFDGLNREIWNTWPTTNINQTTFGWFPWPTRWCSIACGDICRPKFLTLLKSDDMTFNELMDSEELRSINRTAYLTSSNGTFTLFSANGTNPQLLYPSATDTVNNVLLLASDGSLNIKDANGQILWSNGVPGPANNGPFHAYIDAASTLLVQTATNQTYWQFPTPDVNSLVSGTKADTIIAGGRLLSPNGTWELGVTTDGTVVYGKALKGSSLTSLLTGSPGSQLRLLTNGDLSLIAQGGSAETGKSLSGSAGFGVGPFTASVSEAGVVTITDAAGLVTWVYPTPVITSLVSGTVMDTLYAGQQMQSQATPRSVIAVTRSGAIMIQTANNQTTSIFAPNATSSSNTYLRMLTTGNLALTSEGTNGTVVWETQTAGQGIGPYTFSVAADVATVVDSTGFVLWTSPIPVIHALVSGSAVERIYNGQSITAPNSTWAITLKRNGDLTLHNGDGPGISIFPPTGTMKNSFLRMNSDGNLAFLQQGLAGGEVLLRQSNTSKEGHGPYTFSLSDSGVATVIDSLAFNVWTFPEPLIHSLRSGDPRTDRIFNGQAVKSPDNSWALRLSRTGVLGLQHLFGPIDVIFSPSADAKNTFVKVSDNGELTWFQQGAGGGLTSQWQSRTGGIGVGPFSLSVSNAGVVTVNDKANFPTWTYPVPKPRSLVSGSPVDTIYAGQELLSPDGTWSLNLGLTGNLQLLKNGQPSGQSMFNANMQTTQVKMQTDGNFVLYSETWAYLFSPQVHGPPSAAPFTAAVTNEGYFTVTNAQGVQMWQYPACNYPNAMYHGTCLVCADPNSVADVSRGGCNCLPTYNWVQVQPNVWQCKQCADPHAHWNGHDCDCDPGWVWAPGEVCIRT
ncbi:hypothetical protein HDU88_003977 [Geranomyces variabilis]|nr:hypothetical protein HDU88_003977 [Geranomyces variabilis]